MGNPKNNILIVSAFLPYPLNIGGKIRIHKLCKLLSVKYNFILLCLANQNELGYIQELKKTFKDVYVIIERSESKDRLYPYSYKSSFSKSLIVKFQQLMSELSPEIIHIESNELLYLVEYVKNIPVIYTEHDISALSIKNSYYRPVGILFSRIFDYLKRIYFHNKFYRRLYRILALSEADKRAILCFAGEKDIDCLPTGVDLDYFAFNQQRKETNKLIFIGWYLHYPNEDAVIYFVKKIFPHLRRKNQKIELLIVGSDPTDRIKSLARIDGIKVVGEVTDVRGYLDSSSVFISPSRLGSGVRSKVLEAMANGLPVVSTERGCSGINAVANRDIMIADKPYDFVKQILRLLDDSKLRMEIALNARRLVEEQYNWLNIANNLDQIYKEAIFEKK